MLRRTGSDDGTDARTGDLPAGGLLAIVGDGGLLTGKALAERPRSYWDPEPLNARALVRPAARKNWARS
jgi:hypothetical protein